MTQRSTGAHDELDVARADVGAEARLETEDLLPQALAHLLE